MVVGKNFIAQYMKEAVTKYNLELITERLATNIFAVIVKRIKNVR